MSIASRRGLSRSWYPRRVEQRIRALLEGGEAEKVIELGQAALPTLLELLEEEPAGRRSSSGRDSSWEILQKAGRRNTGGRKGAQVPSGWARRSAMAQMAAGWWPSPRWLAITAMFSERSPGVSRQVCQCTMPS